MITKNPGSQVDGQAAASDYLDAQCWISLAAGQTLLKGQPLFRDITQLVNVQGSTPLNSLGGAVFTNQTDIVVASNSANAGDIVGVYQGVQGLGVAGSAATFTNTTGTTGPFPIIVRRLGPGWVLSGAQNGGTAVTVGAKLIGNGAVGPQAVVGARVIGNSIGMVIATPINTTTIASVAAGSNSVNVASFFGLSTSIPLTVDTGSNLEIVTPSAVTQPVPASTVLTTAVVSANTGTVLAVAFAGTGLPAFTVSYTTVAANDTTATLTAADQVKSYNNQIQALGYQNYIQFTLNTAGAITVAAYVPGTAGNSITATASTTSGANYTFAGTAALAGGVNGSFTATFTKAHATNTPLQGVASASGASIVPVSGTANTALIAPVLVDINCLA